MPGVTTRIRNIFYIGFAARRGFADCRFARSLHTWILDFTTRDWTPPIPLPPRPALALRLRPSPLATRHPATPTPEPRHEPDTRRPDPPHHALAVCRRSLPRHAHSAPNHRRLTAARPLRIRSRPASLTVRHNLPMPDTAPESLERESTEGERGGLYAFRPSLGRISAQRREAKAPGPGR